MAEEDARISFDPRTALVVVDVQNDFVDPRGSLHVAGAERIIGDINRLIERAREAGALVVYTQDWHPERTPHFVEHGGLWPRHCVRGTWGAELVPDLLVVDGPVVQKGTGGEDGYSAFWMRDPVSGEERPTALDRLLRERSIERVVVVGVAQEVCVKETALDALRHGYGTAVVAAATRPVDAAGGRRALDEMRAAGAEVV